MNLIAAVVARLLAKQARTCPACKHRFNVPAKDAGTVASCPKCGAKTPPPAKG